MRNKLLLKILICIWCFLAGSVLGCGICATVADNAARLNITDDNIDLIILAIETDNNVHVSCYYYSKKYEILTFETREGYTYHFTAKKVAPFRYELVEVDFNA